MPHRLDAIRRRDPRTLLMYSPLQFAPGETSKPDGSLSLAYLAGALRRADLDVRILDCAVGDADAALDDTFFRSTQLPTGLMRVGMSPAAILAAAEPYDIIGVSSIFTTQSAMALELVRLIKARFFQSGVDLIAISEADETIVQIARALQGHGSLTSTPGVAFLDENGREVVNPVGPVVADLDELPLPAWDLLPLAKYWDISRPHGGQFLDGQRIPYASLQTSRGCPFRCAYCHISREQDGDAAGRIGQLRLKSIDRVMQELEILKGLGVQYVFFEDDSLFAKKKRAHALFELVRGCGLSLIDVNGVNICHFQTNQNGVLDIDVEFIHVLAEAGFEFITLPVESASQRVLDRWASAKWRVDKTNTEALIRAFNRAGIRVSGNYMMGFPDETQGEIFDTVMMAKRHVEQGLNHALFFAVVPFPGTTLFDYVIANGQLDPDFDTDTLRWTKSVLKNLSMSIETLEGIRQTAFLTVNRSEYVDYKRRMVIADRPVAAAT
jgi:anaerobic magnesium-protoporphyrin IX monomethyl ester cyclase